MEKRSSTHLGRKNHVMAVEFKPTYLTLDQAAELLKSNPNIFMSKIRNEPYFSPIIQGQ